MPVTARDQHCFNSRCSDVFLRNSILHCKLNHHTEYKSELNSKSKIVSIVYDKTVDRILLYAQSTKSGCLNTVAVPRNPDAEAV